MKYKTYEVWYLGKLIETISATSKKSVRESYSADNESETAFGHHKKWVMKELKIVEAET